MNKVKYRKFRFFDLNSLAKIVSETWSFNQYVTGTTAILISKFIIIESFLKSNGNIVSVENNKPIGIIFWERKNYTSFRPLYKLINYYLTFRLALRSDIDIIIELGKNIADANQKLYALSSENYQAEITLFVVDKNQQNKGIGKRMFNDTVSQMNNKNVDKFYLYTDTRCNYGFYNHLGMYCLGEIDNNLVNSDKNTTKFFIYDNVKKM